MAQLHNPWRDSRWKIVGHIPESLRELGQTHHLQLDWPQNPTAILLGYWAAGFAITGATSTIAAKFMKPELLLIGILALWISLCFLTSIYVNGASYLFILPAVLTASTYSKAKNGGELGLMITQ